MSDMSDYLRSAVGNHVLRNTALTSPTTVYVGLTSENTSWTELSGNGYSRKAITFDAPATPGVFKNNEVVFDEATDDWSEATGWGIYDAETSGNRLIEAALTTARTVLSGDTARFADDAITISFQ